MIGVRAAGGYWFHFIVSYCCSWKESQAKIGMIRILKFKKRTLFFNKMAYFFLGAAATLTPNTSLKYL